MKKRLAAMALAAIAARLVMLNQSAEDAVNGFIYELFSPQRSVYVTYEVEPIAGAYAKPDESAGLDTGAEPTAPAAAADAGTPVIDVEVLSTTISGGNLSVNNATSYEIDPAMLLAEELALKLPYEGVQVLIIHTHGSEAYTPTIYDNYEASDPFRTQDPRYSVIRVGEELASALEAQGLTVLHDKGVYDYPSYTGSYGRSLEAVERYLNEYPEIAVVIDLHRDALGENGVVYKTVAALQGETSSQLMFVVGTGENGLSHPNWEENLKLALKLQNAVSESFPTLARPIALKQERYNQHLTAGSLILEVGSSGNTLSEALSAVRLFAQAAGPVLKGMIE